MVMGKQAKKIIAPVIVTLIVVLYFAFISRMSLLQPLPLMARILAIAIPLALISVSIYVLIERIKEIRSGEDDDLSKY
ncbi:MAG TPA: hypothetical protein VFC74_05235 [Oscillospiraceae bacterium]|nr:hypothetical protein [Oscillospiraceae bacterium]